MNEERIPHIVPTLQPVSTIGAATLTRIAFRGGDLDEVLQQLIASIDGSANDAGVMLDASLVLQLVFRREEALRLQRQALEQCTLFRVRGATAPPASPRLKLLALVAPGDLMVNTPLEFIVEGSSVQLDLLYLLPDRELPESAPDHDLLFLAVSEPDDNMVLLERIARIAERWPRPVVNDARRIMRLSRPEVFAMLHDLPGVHMPPTVMVERLQLTELESSADAATRLLFEAGFPLLVRPVGSHAGAGLEKLDGPGELSAYLERSDAGRFYVTPFVDYASSDGLFRKYRIVFLEGKPYLCHMAISESWMLHYANAGMEKSQAKRDEEARAMETFETGFARRHERALEEIYRRVGLEYLVIDCGESPDGRLLLFEADAAMVIHSMDPPDLFPYKKAHMERVFQAFYAMLAAKAGRAAAGSTG